MTGEPYNKTEWKDGLLFEENEWDGLWFEEMNEMDYGLTKMNEMDYSLKKMNEMGYGLKEINGIDYGLREMNDTMTKPEVMWGWVMMSWWNFSVMKSITKQRDDEILIYN